MNMNRKSLARLASVLLLGIALAGCASVPGAPSPELMQRIEAARTRSDHESLATYYEREATLARTNAADHRKMSRSYQAMAAGGRGGSSMSVHCNSIVRLYEGLAAEYEGLAGDHRQFAASAQP